jgi:hypothetical protein
MLLVPTSLIWAVSYFIHMGVIKVFTDDETDKEIRLREIDRKLEIKIYSNDYENSITTFYIDDSDLVEFIFEIQQIKKQIDE